MMPERLQLEETAVVKVMMRPLQAINIVHEQMRSMLEQMSG